MHPLQAPEFENVRCVLVQLDEARKQLDARQKTRAREGSRLRSALTNLEAQAAADAQQVISAQQAHEELLKNLPSYLSPASQARSHPPTLAPKCHVGRPAPAGAVQAPPSGTLAPIHQPPSLSARPHSKKSVSKLTPPRVAQEVMAPRLQGMSSAAAKSALRVVPFSMAPNASSPSAREILPEQQAAWRPTLLQQASASTAQTRHACSALEQNAQLASLPQGTYSAQWLAAASAQAQGLMLQRRYAAAREDPQPLLKRSKLSSPCERAGWLSGSAVVATARNALMEKRVEATAGTNKLMLLPAGSKTLQEELMTEQVGSMTQQGGFTTQQVGSMTQQGGCMTQQGGWTTQQMRSMTQQTGSMTQQSRFTTQQMGSMTQQTGSMTQQAPSLPLPWAGTARAVHQAQNPAAPSATLSAQVAQLHSAATITSCTAHPRLALPPAAGWTRRAVSAAQSGKASPGRQTAPVPMQATALQSQQCQPQAVPKSATLASPCQPAAALTAAGTASAVAPLLDPYAGSLSAQSAAQPSATASVASVAAASVPAALGLTGPGRSSLQAVASQQQLVSGVPALATSGQAFMTQEISCQVKAPSQTYHLQAPTCSMSAASSSSMTTVSAARGLSSTSTVHPDVAYIQECQMLPSQHVLAQGLLAQPSVALRAAAVSSTSGTPSAQAVRVQSYVAQSSGAQGSCPQPPQILSSSRAHACRSVHSSCTSIRAATPNPQQTHTESSPTAGIFPQLQAPASLGLPSELLALSDQSGACTSHTSNSQLPHSGSANASSNMHLPVKSASWQTGGLNKSIMPDHRRRDSQQQANIMLGGMY